MKQTTRVALIVSAGCLLTGIGGMAMPALRETFSNAVAPAPKEEPAPPITQITPADDEAPRYRIQYLDETVKYRPLQAIALNNKGEVLCVAEEREPYTINGRRGPSLRYRVLHTRYFIFRQGKMEEILDLGPEAFFRPIAFNDLGQVLCFTLDPAGNEKPLSPSAPRPRQTAPGFISANAAPVVRNTRLAIWEDGSFRYLNVGEALVKAGMPDRYKPFLESAMVMMNGKGQILIGLQNLYLWENGKALRIGTGGVTNGERVFINDLGTTVRRSEQYRSSPDGNSAYPLVALYRATEKKSVDLDFGFSTFPVDLNGKDELLLGRMYLPAPDSPRTEFRRWDGKEQQPLFTLNGRTPARFNNQGWIVAWRQVDNGSDWRSFFTLSTSLFSVNTPVIWNGKRLYDLRSLVPGNPEITSMLDFNDRNELLIQIRQNNRIRAALLTPILATDAPPHGERASSNP